MALTLLDMAKASRNPLAAGISKAIATSDDLISQIPFSSTLGDSISYDREKALPTVEFVSPTHTSITESSPTYDKVTVPLRLIVSDVDVYEFAQRQQNEINDPTSLAIASKLKALGRTLGQKIVTGGYATSGTMGTAIAGLVLASTSPIGPNQDSTRMGPGSLKYVHSGTLASYRAPGDRDYGTAVNVGASSTYTLTSDNPNKWIRVTSTSGSLAANGTSEITISSTTEEFDGISSLIPTSHAQVISSTGASGDALGFTALDRAIDEFVKVRENLFWIGNSKMKSAFMGLQRSLGGTTPEHVQLPGLNRPVPAYRGIPFLQNDWIPSTETKTVSTLTSLYLVSLSEEGLSMVVGNDPGATLDTDPREARVMGVRVRDIGELEQKEARRTRVSMYVTTRLKSELAVCRIRELTTA